MAKLRKGEGRRSLWSILKGNGDSDKLMKVGASGTVAKTSDANKKSQELEQEPPARRKFAPRHAERDALLQMPAHHLASAFQQHNPFAFGVTDIPLRHPSYEVPYPRCSHGDSTPKQDGGNTFTFSFGGSPDGGTEGITVSSPSAAEPSEVEASEAIVESISSATSTPANAEDQSTQAQFLELARRLMLEQSQPANAVSKRSPAAVGPHRPSSSKGKERVVHTRTDSPHAAGTSMSATLTTTTTTTTTTTSTSTTKMTMG